MGFQTTYHRYNYFVIWPNSQAFSNFVQQQLQVICFSYQNSNRNLSKISPVICNMARFMVMGGFQLVDLNITELKSLLKNRGLSLVENLFFKKNPLQDFLSIVNAVISTNEST